MECESFPLTALTTTGYVPVGVVGVGVGVVPPPPPQATQTPPKISIITNNSANGRRWVADVNISSDRAGAPASNHNNPAAGPRLGGILRCREGGVLLPPVVTIFSALAAGEALVGLTDAGEIVQVAAAGHPLATLRFTVPVNPPTEVTVRAAVPGWPGAEMTIGEGFADTLKSAVLTETADDVDPE